MARHRGCAEIAAALNSVVSNFRRSIWAFLSHLSLRHYTSAMAAMDCGSELDKHVGMVTKMSKASAAKAAALHRMAMQGYDYCMAGMELDGKMRSCSMIRSPSEGVTSRLVFSQRYERGSSNLPFDEYQPTTPRKNDRRMYDGPRRQLRCAAVDVAQAAVGNGFATPVVSARFYTRFAELGADNRRLFELTK